MRGIPAVNFPYPGLCFVPYRLRPTCSLRCISGFPSRDDLKVGNTEPSIISVCSQRPNQTVQLFESWILHLGIESIRNHC